MKIPTHVLNPRLYSRAYHEVTQTYGTQTSAYRSMAIVKRYKALGGKYAKSLSKKDGTVRWRKERWTTVLPYVLKGQVVPCGATNRRRHACRPLTRVTSKTPITLDEVIRKYGRAKVAKFARIKQTRGSERVHLLWK